jgi:HD-GYP domain-containing protein (c-di-GMP phosphodiesterase class II)
MQDDQFPVKDFLPREPIAEEIDFDTLSSDRRLNRLLKSVLGEVKLYAEDQIKHIKQLAQIGLALSSEKDISKLLVNIVDQARNLSNADAGTLYIMEDDKKFLRFEILQNDSLSIRMGGTNIIEQTMAKVPLYDQDGRPNHANVSSYTAITGNIVNIPDVYEAEGFDFTGPRKYDESTGYRSKSMLVIPLRNHENDIIGVLQLLNAQDRSTGEVVAFSPEYVDLIGSLASQAAVALTNTQLIQDLKNLFYAFIRSIATAIDAKSPYTRGHIDRVVDLTLMIAGAINETTEGAFKDTYFNNDEIEEMRIAAWMHDVGKITTPEYIVNKATKVETIFDRIHLIETRFNLIAEQIKTRFLNQKIQMLSNESLDNPGIDRIDQKCSEKLAQLSDDLEFIKACNSPGEFLENNSVDRVGQIAARTYFLNGGEQPYLTADEVENLCIRKGSLTEVERDKIQDHATMTLKMLSQLPFPKKLSNVAEYASSHHERLDGSGYPRGLSEDELSLQSKIMAVADIFEALTAKDRPYKKPMKLSQAIKILGFMEKDKHIDPEVLAIFMSKGLHHEYARLQMNPDQIDI